MDERVDSQIELDNQDIALVEALQAGGKSSFDTLVLKYQDRVFRTCFRLLGEYEEANDCAQEAFVKAYRSLKGFRLESKFSTWLYRIAVNICKNRLASLSFRYKKKTLSIDCPVESEDGSTTFEISDESLSPRSEIDRKEKSMLIQKAIDSLPDDQKQLVVLRDIEGLSYKDIAEVTGYNLGTVKSKLSRARQQLRGILKGLR